MLWNALRLVVYRYFGVLQWMGLLSLGDSPHSDRGLALGPAVTASTLAGHGGSAGSSLASKSPSSFLVCSLGGASCRISTRLHQEGRRMAEVSVLEGRPGNCTEMPRGGELRTPIMGLPLSRFVSLLSGYVLAGPSFTHMTIITIYRLNYSLVTDKA